MGLPNTTILNLNLNSTDAKLGMHNYNSKNDQEEKDDKDWQKEVENKTINSLKMH